ncbi:MAG: dephospho-CoA kinase [Eubacteriales bacterium]|nr:dephospho-CoA kinase [Eubacteriales bacterium]
MILGITGGVGAGKSTVLDILNSKYGYEIIRTDDIAKEIMESTECISRLICHFGKDILNDESKLDKEKYAALIYADKKNRDISDSIIHPMVWEKVRKIIETAPSKDFAVETALPSGIFKKFCDKVIFVKADTSVRIDRLMKNRNYSEEYSRKIIASQLKDENFMRFSDVVLDNSGSIKDIEKELEGLLKSFR